MCYLFVKHKTINEANLVQTGMVYYYIKHSLVMHAIQKRQRSYSTKRA